MPSYEIELRGKITVDAESPDQAVAQILSMETLDLQMNLIFNVTTPLSAIYKSVSEAARHRKVDNTFWSVPQAAKVLGIGAQSIRNWIKAGKYFDPNLIARVGRGYRIPRSEVERILNMRVDKYIGKSILIQS